MKRNNKGFTLVELLIVVAIIAVLVAIAIPTFGGQVERAREAADAANLRAAYAEASAKYLTDGTTPVTIKGLTFSQTGEWDTKPTLPFALVTPTKDYSSVTFDFSTNPVGATLGTEK